MLNAIVSGRRSGGAGRLLPQDLPPWKTVSHYCRLWRVQDLWPALPHALQTVRRRPAGREPNPRAAISDRHSVKPTLVGGPRGDDGGQKVHGRQRHRLVAPHGLIMRALGPPADRADRDGAQRLLAPLQGQGPRLQHIWADRAYRGTGRAWIESPLGCPLEIVHHWGTGVRWGWGAPGHTPPTLPSGFHVLPRRWIVESRHR